MVILVLGGTSRVGRETVKLLAASGRQKVRVLVRDRAKAAAFSGAGVEVVTGEMTDPASLAQALRNVERVFTIPPNVRDQAEMESRIYHAAQRAGVSHIVKLSTVKAALSSPCYFFQQHALAEQSLKDSDVAFTILRCNSFMQNLLWFAAEIKTKSSFSLPMGTAKTAPLDIRDVAAVASAILHKGEAHYGTTYNISGPEKLSFAKIAQILSAATGKQVEYRDIDPAEFLQMLLRTEIPAWYAEAVTASWSVARAGEPIVTSVVAELTKKPPLTFAQFARDYAEQFQR
ncbi:MAG TPA: SDR family oxidoreductase [Pyrinomonadaceae bacterium]